MSSYPPGTLHRTQRCPLFLRTSHQDNPRTFSRGRSAQRDTPCNCYCSRRPIQCLCYSSSEVRKPFRSSSSRVVLTRRCSSAYTGRHARGCHLKSTSRCCHPPEDLSTPYSRRMHRRHGARSGKPLSPPSARLPPPQVPRKRRAGSTAPSPGPRWRQTPACPAATQSSLA